MIDRERLLEILNVPIYPHENVDPLEAVADYLLDNGVTFQMWIPVTERLPEEGTGNVLMARNYKGKPYVDIGEFISGTACCWGDEYAQYPREHITTHWMPLPTPPNE